MKMDYVNAIANLIIANHINYEHFTGFKLRVISNNAILDYV